MGDDENTVAPSLDEDGEVIDFKKESDELIESIVDEIRDSLGDFVLPISITKVSDSFITFEEPNIRNMVTTVNQSDTIDLDIKLLVSALVTIKNYKNSAISLGALENSNPLSPVLGQSNIPISNVISYTVFDSANGKIVTHGADELASDDTIQISTNELVDRLLKSGIIYDATGDQLIYNNSIELDTWDDSEYSTVEDKMESSRQGSLTNIVRRMTREKKKSRTRKKSYLRSRRRKTPDGRKRSRSMKLSWKKNRSKRLRGMRKYHKSAKGKRANKLRGLARAKVY